MTSPPPFQPEQKKSNTALTCLGGCLGVTLLIVILGAVGAYVAYQYTIGQIVALTDDAPKEIPKVEITEEAREDLQARLDAFEAAYEGNEDGSRTLELSADDLNTVLQSEEIAENIAIDSAFLTVEGDTVRGDISLPMDDLGLDQLGIDALKGRYLNASARLSVSLANGQLYVYLRDALVKGEPLPETAMAQLQNVNLAERILQEDPEARKVVERFETIEIRDGKIWVTLKEGAAPQPQGEGGSV